MGIMGKKVTRRVALGTAFGGLAAAPFVLRTIAQVPCYFARKQVRKRVGAIRQDARRSNCRLRRSVAVYARFQAAGRAAF